MGDHAGRDQAGRGDHPGDHPARARRSARPLRARASPARRRRARPTPTSSRTCPATTRASRSARREAPGWHDYADADARRRASRPTGRPRPTTAAALLHLRHHRQARSWCGTPTSPTRSGTCRPCTGSACGPATCTSTSPRPAGPSTPGATSSRPGTPGDVLIFNYEPLRRRGPARRARQLRRHHAVRAADGVAHADPGGPRAASDRPLREVIGAGEPLNPEVIEQVQRAWGITLRDGFGQTETTAQIGNPPGQPVKPGSMGRPLPGYEVVLLDRRRHGRRRRRDLPAASTRAARSG